MNENFKREYLSIPDKLFKQNDQLVRRVQELEQKEQALINITGCDVDKLIELFAAGYTLTPPKVEQKLGALSEKDINQALYFLRNPGR